ncbi:MAG: glycosyltransferase family 4 protein [Crocinitomicaceae bacterium]|nr:glycosyltransferase family 4 protein [Crocinitomicaceae bacterium]
MIGMLLEMDYPKDIRVRKEAESLVTKGMEVVVVTPWKKGMLRSEIVNGVHIERIGRNHSHIKKGLADMVSSIFFINFLFYFRLKGIVKKYNIQHFHVHDLPLAKTAYLKRKLIPGRVLLDSHENYPELLEGWFLVKKSWFVEIKNKLLFSPKRWKKHEARIMPKMDELIVVIEEMRDKFIDLYKLDEKHVTVVSNYEKKSFAQSTKNMELDESFKFEEEVFYLVYVGGIGPMRGINTVIDGVSELKKRGQRVQFLIIGGGNNLYIESLKKQVSDLELDREVSFLGYKPFAMVNYYMQNAQINIIPHIRNGHTDYTIPHKLFQIFLSKAPLLLSSCKPLERIVSGCDGGWVFEASNPLDLADKVEEIAKNNDEAVRKAENGYEISMNQFNWESAAEELMKLYQRING